MKKHLKLIRITSVIIILLIVLYLYLFAFSLKASPKINNDLMDFDILYNDAEEHGFIDGNLLTNTNKLVAKNNNYELYLNETNTHFYIKDLTTGNIIESNPSIDDPANPSDNTLARQKATIEYRYFNKIGSRSNANNNYNKSIYHPETPEYAEGHKTYKVKEVENGFQVFYRVTTLEIDYLYFPLYLEPEAIEPIINDRQHPARRTIMNAYWDTIDEKTGLYKARSYENMSGIIRKDLYKVFYEDKWFGEYSRERAIEENAKNGYFEEIVRFGFDIAIQVLLEDDGVEIKVINNSIKEYSESKLAEISLYPYFGSAIDIDPISNTENEGYLVVPDGSGAIINFNNGKTSARSFSKRVYGRDLAYLPYEMPEEQENILVPVYGMIKDDIGYATIIEEGDSHATINANVSGVSRDSYNRIYPSFRLREYEFSVIGSGWNTHEINIWTKDLIKTDITLKIKILTGDKNNYVGVANEYKEFLIKKYDLTKNLNLNKKTIIEFLGAYDKRDMFLGVPYKNIKSLTTYNQALKILDELEEMNVDNLDLVFSGITNGGLDNDFETKVKFEKTVGKKKTFNKFKKQLKERDIEVFPSVNFFSTNNFNKPLENNRYTSNRVKGARSHIFDYHVPTRLPYSETAYDHRDEHLVINPRYYDSIYEKYNKSYNFDNLFLLGVGSDLAGNYKKKNVTYLYQSQIYQENLLSKISDDKKVAISEPLGFSYPYLNTALDLPFESTIYTILDYRIPFVQLILSGLANYTHKSINLASQRDIDYQFLKTLENGASLKYTLTYKNSLELLGTDHNQYMSTEYTNWLDVIKEHNDVIVTSGFDKANIIGHERLSSNVFKTYYDNNKFVITNYNLTNVIVDGIEINGIDYYIGGGS